MQLNCICSECGCAIENAAMWFAAYHSINGFIFRRYKAGSYFVAPASGGRDNNVVRIYLAFYKKKIPVSDQHQPGGGHDV